MKKIRFIWLFLLILSIFVTGCKIKTNNNKPVVDFPEVDGDQSGEVEEKPKEDEEIVPPKQDENSGDSNEMTDEEFEEWLNNKIKEEQEGLSVVIEKIKPIIPDEINQNITLPVEYIVNKIKYTIIWGSSDYESFSSKGEYSMPAKDKVITITALVRSEYSEEVFSKEVFIKGYGEIVMKPLDTSKKLVFAYLRDSTFSTFTSADIEQIDVINYCFAPISQGKISVSGLSRINEILKVRREGVRVVLSLGGGHSLGFGPACSTKEKRQILIDSIMKVIKEYEFDGVDFDWEYPGWSGLEDSTPNDKYNFTLLCKELRQAFDEYKEGLLITAAVIGGLTASSLSSFYDVANLNLYLDYFHVMTYDQNINGKATHNSNLFSSSTCPYSGDKAMKAWVAAGASKDKLILGAAFYGKIMTFTSADKTIGSNTSGVSSISYDAIMANYFNKNGFVEYYDEETQSYYLKNNTTFITYENKKSILNKCEYVINNGYGGMMFWEYGLDDTKTLLNAMYEGFKK